MYTERNVMERAEVLERVQNIFREVFDNENLIISDNTIADYNMATSDIEEWDSLGHVNLIVEIENEFGIKFPMERVMRLRNVGEIIDLILELIK